MDFDSSHLVLAVVAVVIITLIRTLIRAGKEINSSDKFPTSKNRQDSKDSERDDDNSEVFVTLVDAYGADDAQEDFQEFLDKMSIRAQSLSMRHDEGHIVVTCNFGDIWLQLPDTPDSVHNINGLDVPKMMLDDAINYVYSQFDDTDEVTFYAETGYEKFTVEKFETSSGAEVFVVKDKGSDDYLLFTESGFSSIYNEFLINKVTEEDMSRLSSEDKHKINCLRT